MAEKHLQLKTNCWWND